MSDRIHGYTVTLDRDYKDEDAAAIKAAIEMVKGVLSVDEHVKDHHDHLARVRLSHQYEKKIYEALKDLRNSSD